jgi:murein DD-endopeptidase MepM/ murein hydrolase activator NlpD
MKINSKNLNKDCKKFKISTGFRRIMIGFGLCATCLVSFLGSFTFSRQIKTSKKIPEKSGISAHKMPQKPPTPVCEENSPIDEAVECATEPFVASVSKKSVTPVCPVTGKVTKKFSLDNLVYSKTMDDWRVHNGIDIECEVGAPVKAVNDGIVDKVFQNDEQGVTVIISHENYVKSIYSNLQDINFISSEKAVSQGDIIGGVGTTSLYESQEQPHLHFSITRNGKFEDPENYLKL